MKFLAVVLASCVLAACGGGSGSGGSSNQGSTPADLTISGTAATGRAIAGAAINAKCQVGTGAATTNADGTFSLNVIGGTLPCLLQIANPLDGTKLHTVATGSGNTAIANITPLTEMLVARVLRNDPAVFFATFDPAIAVNTMTAANLKAAQVDVGAILSGAVDTSSLTDFIATTLRAATANDLTRGDAQDKLLDALRAKLSPAQITQVVSALVKTSSTAEIKQFVANLLAVPPTANAGVDQSVVTGTVVTLDGSASAVSAARMLTYTWTLTAKPANSSATLVSPTSAKPTFTADVAGTYVASVVVNDGLVSSSTAAVSITASVLNAPPIANAGVSQNVVAGTIVTLDGSVSSDANSDPLTYFWTLSAKPAGSIAILSSSNSAKPIFTADVAGSYVATLVVNDSKVSSNTATVNITAALANVAPVAKAGDAQNAVAGEIVRFDGSASSDANGDTLTYAWTMTSMPPGSTVRLMWMTSAKPDFTADMPGTYVMTLVVNDGKVNSAAATTTVTLLSAGTPIGGIISTDTHLFLDKSPYLITNTLQIASGTTLTIDPGVKVKSTGFPINVYGTLKVSGTPSAYVQLDSVSINNSGTSSTLSSSIQISYAKLNNGSLMPPSGNAVYGNIVLTDSILTSVNTSSGSNYMYIWYPEKDCFIERNIFKNSGGLSIGVDTRNVARKVYIRNNVFTGIIGDAVKNWASYGGETTVVSANSFLDIGQVVLRLPSGYDAAAMTATGNYWGTSDQVQVQSRIYDKSNDLSSAGLVNFLPLLTKPDALTPTYP
ncbi:PKD domain-containing protein [Polaromonas sp. DSR2-3-2]|uniref:PKD domain-containing protein n=1 Tax=unclassified Polaromonas TaxID=2638319 RepID=UPI003CE71793